MKKILISIFIVFFLFSCVEKEKIKPRKAFKKEVKKELKKEVKKTSVVKKEYRNAPIWIFEKNLYGNLKVLEIAKITNEGIRKVRYSAERKAKKKILDIINLKIKNTLINFNKKIELEISEEASNDTYVQISNFIKKSIYKNSKTRKLWKSPENNLHVLMILDENFAKVVIKKALDKIYKNNEVIWQNFTGDKWAAYQKLDEEIQNISF